MTDRHLVPSPSTGGNPQPRGTVRPCPPGVTKVSSHAAAAKDLADTPYLVYCLAQCAKLFLKLIEKRWPEMA